MKKSNVILSALSLLAVSASSAFAVPVVDYTAVGTAVTAEIGPSIATILPIAGTLLAVGVGWKLVKRFTK